MQDIDQRQLVARFRAARAYAGMDQRALAEAIGWSTSAWNRVEKHRAEIKPRERDGLIAKITEVTGVPADWFTAAWGKVGQTDGGSGYAPPQPAWAERLLDEVRLLREEPPRPGWIDDAENQLARLLDKAEGEPAEPEWVGRLEDQLSFVLAVIRKVHREAAAEVISEGFGGDELPARREQESTAAPAPRRSRRRG